MLAVLMIACGRPPMAPAELVESTFQRQAWLGLEPDVVACSYNLHWPALSDASKLRQMILEQDAGAPDSIRITMADPVSQDMLVTIARTSSAPCTTDGLSEKFRGFTKLEFSSARGVTEEEWLEEMAGLGAMTCRFKVVTELNGDDLYQAMRKVMLRRMGGVFQYTVEGSVVELNLYRNCGLSEPERQKKYKELIAFNR